MWTLIRHTTRNVVGCTYITARIPVVRLLISIPFLSRPEAVYAHVRGSQLGIVAEYKLAVYL